MTDDIILEASHVSMIYGHNKARAAQLMEAGGEKQNTHSTKTNPEIST